MDPGRDHPSSKEFELDGPEYGPRGYLPSKAAKRARKIVLREQMGFGWPLAALGAALLVAVAGGAYLRYGSGPPAAPFTSLAPITATDASGATVISGPDGGQTEALVVRAAGPVRVFAIAPGEQAPAWCPETRQLESPGAAWSPDGRTVFGGQPSLQPLRSVVFDGVLYVDFTTPLPVAPPGSGGVAPGCA